VRERKRTEVKSAVAAPSPTVKVGFALSARAAWDALDPKVRDSLREKIRAFGLDPRLGKPLTGDLKGCHRVTHGRVRCVVRRAEEITVVLVIAVGVRKEGSKKDPYAFSKHVLDMAQEDFDALVAAHALSQLRVVDQLVKNPKKKKR
jgi:mRNA interferase RelE/StbE